MDTDTRKFSAINISSPWRGVNAIPSGALDEPEQFSIVHLYNEFAAEEGGGGGDGTRRAPVRLGGMMVFG